MIISTKEETLPYHQIIHKQVPNGYIGVVKMSKEEFMKTVERKFNIETCEQLYREYLDQH